MGNIGKPVPQLDDMDHLQKSWRDPEDSRGQGFEDSSEILRARVQGVRDSGIQAECLGSGFKGSGVRGFKGSAKELQSIDG